jgi:hypothetical protein
LREWRGAGFIGRTPRCFGFLSGAIGRETTFPPGDHRLGWSRVQLDNSLLPGHARALDDHSRHSDDSGSGAERGGK